MRPYPLRTLLILPGIRQWESFGCHSRRRFSGRCQRQYGSPAVQVRIMLRLRDLRPRHRRALPLTATRPTSIFTYPSQTVLIHKALTVLEMSDSKPVSAFTYNERFSLSPACWPLNVLRHRHARPDISSAVGKLHQHLDCQYFEH